jgi:tetratricopeptide (TPR) repeat protein
MQREASYKAAACLLALGRAGDARGLLEQTAGEEQDLPASQRRWLAASLAQLWSLHAEANRPADAEAAFAALQQAYSLEELAVLLPPKAREALMESYEIELGTYGYFATLNLQSALDRLKQAVTVLEKLGASRSAVQRARLRVLEALMFDGDVAGAREMLARFFARSDLTPRERLALQSMQTWVLVHEGRPEAARDELRALAFDDQHRVVPAYVALLQDLARLHGRLQEWPQAEEAIEAYFENAGELRGTALDIEAWVIAGFVRRRLGKDDEARQAWSQAFDVAKATARFDLLDTTIAGSLCGRLSVDDVPKIIELLPHIEGSKLSAEVRRRIADDGFVAALLRNMWRSRRGLETAERIRFFGCTFAESAFLQGLVGMHEVFRQAIAGASAADDPYSLPLANELPPDVEQMMWQATERLSDAFRERRLSELDFLRLFQTHYRGVTNVLFGWDGVRDAFEPRTRGPIGYAMACRLAELGQFAKARELLAAVAVDAATIRSETPQEAALLEQLAAKKLQELEGK